MTAQATRFDAAAACFSGAELAQSFTLARAAAKDRVLTLGLPQKRDEYWRYSDPTGLTARAVTPIQEHPLGEAPASFVSVSALKLVFVDGVFDASASDVVDFEGVEISLLAEAPTWATDFYGSLEACGQNPVARPLAALNTALAQQGVIIRVTGQCTKPISFEYISKTNSSDAILHHLVKVEEGASLTLLESGTLGLRGNMVLEVELADCAQFHHVRTQGQDHDRNIVTHLFARLGNEAVLKSFNLTMNGKFTRNEAVIELIGHDAKAHLAGAAIGGTGFHHDDTIFITHQGLRGESRQVFKKVLNGGAVGVFQGKILVKQSAQKTDGYQMSQSLLLDDNSEFLAKPELEIYADDVKCSHGSTTGAIDETALFYLRSRGVPTDQAQALLILAFLADTLAEIDDAGLAERLREVLIDWVPQVRA